MVLAESEPQDSLLDFEYYTFKCPSCGDTERRLLPRGRVPITKILRTTTATPAPLRKPQERIGKREDPSPIRTRPAGPPPRGQPSTAPKPDPDRVNELLKNPRKFIDAFVRGNRTNKPV